ncbi:hypothetical protein ACHAWF_005528 [Thalassiosira exigua]
MVLHSAQPPTRPAQPCAGPTASDLSDRPAGTHQALPSGRRCTRVLQGRCKSVFTMVATTLAMPWRLASLLLVLSWWGEAFVLNERSPATSNRRILYTQQLRVTSLRGSLFGLGEGEKKVPPSQRGGDPSIPTRVLEIPVSSIKKGGLRFALGLHLIGQQDNGTWKANQANESSLDMFFKDNSAKISVVLDENLIGIDRYGARPSLVYMLQESILLHSLLDELKTLAFEGSIEDENRLLRFEKEELAKARAALPARKA